MHTVLIWQSVLGTELSGVNYLGQVGLETRVSLENVQVWTLASFSQLIVNTQLRP